MTSLTVSLLTAEIPMHRLTRMLWIAVLPLLNLSTAPPNAPSPPERSSTAPRVAAEPNTKRSDDANALFAQAKAALERKELAEARTKTAKAVELLVAEGAPPLSPAEDQLLSQLGTLAKDLGDLPTSHVARARVVVERELRLPPDHPDVTAARQSLALTLRNMGDLKGALVLQERVLEVRERTLKDDDADLGIARSNLGVTLQVLGELSRARKLFERVLETRERTLPSAHPSLAIARQNLALALKAQGNLPAARALEELVLLVRERTLPADHPDLTAARHNLALTLRYQGDLSTARALQEEVLEVSERTLPEGNLDLAGARANLATTLRMLGDLQAARELLERVLVVSEQSLPEYHVDLAGARMSLAITLKNQGNLSAASELEERALAVLERTLPADNQDLSGARQNLAVTRKLQRDFEGARVLEERVLEVRERTLPSDHPNLTMARQNLAFTLRNLGLLAEARALLQRVLDVQERTLPADHPDLAGARGNMAQTLGAILVSGKEDKESTRQGLITLAPEFVRGLRQMARAALLDGSPREVEDRLASHEVELAHAISLALGYGIVDVSADLPREAFLLGESIRAGGPIAARLAARAGGDGIGRELRERILVATKELARLSQTGGGARELSQARAAADLAGRELALHACNLLGGTGPLDPTLELLTQDLDATDALVAWRRVKLSSLHTGDPPQWSEIDSLIAFVLRPVRPPSNTERTQSGPRLTLLNLGPYAPVEQAATAWRNSLSGASPGRGVALLPTPSLAESSDAQKLRELVLDPLREALAGVEHLTVVLDDLLHAVPFDAMPAGSAWGPSPTNGAQNQLLGDVLDIHVRSSLIELLLPREEPRGESLLLAIGGAAFDSDPNAPARPEESGGQPIESTSRSADKAGILRGGAWERKFTELTWSNAEAHEIAQSFRQTFGAEAPSILLEKRQASREAFSELAPQARWLHVATHGWFAPESVRSTADPLPEAQDRLARLCMDPTERLRGMAPMLLCGLAFAGANLPMNAAGRVPGLITAQEISALDLSNCELVVLSACDTNVGDRRAGQGVASLQKALIMAGARSAITSLWSVPDKATKELMAEFYRRVWVDKQPKHQALWDAKRKLRDAKDERGNPRFAMSAWAAWVLTGNPE